MRRRPIGFTLIEILVVMFIVSVMTGIAVVNMPAFVSSGEFETESRRLMTLLRMVQEEAIMQGEEYGIRVEPTTYEFLVYDEAARAWTPITARPFNARVLPEGMELLLEVEEDAAGLSLDEEEESGPEVMIFSSGEVTPFELILAQPDANLARQLGTDGYRAIEWRENDEAF